MSSYALKNSKKKKKVLILIELISDTSNIRRTIKRSLGSKEVTAQITTYNKYSWDDRPEQWPHTSIAYLTLISQPDLTWIPISVYMPNRVE